MPGLRGLSGHEVKQALVRDGWRERPSRGKGSHVWVMKKPGNPNNIVVTNKRDLGIGLVRKIIARAGLTPEAFEALLTGDRS